MSSNNSTSVCNDSQIGADSTWEKDWMNTVFTAVSVVSMTVSALNIVVWSRVSTFSLKDMFLALEAANLLYVVFYLPVRITNRYFHYVIRSDVYVYLYWISSHYCMWSVIFTGLLSTAVGLWRCFAVTWPMKANLTLTSKRAKLVIFLCVVLSLLPVVFHATTIVRKHGCEEDKGDYKVLENYGAKMRPWVNENGRTLIYVWLAIYIVYYLVPCICFVVAYSIIIVILFRRRSRIDALGINADKENRTTFVIGFLMAFFLISYPGLTIIFIFDVQRYTEAKATHLSPVLQFLFPTGFLVLLVNCFSFLAYYLMCSKFRHTARELFTRLLPMQRKKSVVSRTLSDNISLCFESSKTRPNMYTPDK